MAEDRTGALAAWRALPPESRRRAWAAAAKPAAIEDPELAAVVARYATAMRGQVPAAILVVALAALFAWLAVAGFLITHGRNGLGVVLAAVGVIAAGLGIGALQVRQANFDRRYPAGARAGPGRYAADSWAVCQTVSRPSSASVPRITAAWIAARLARGAYATPTPTSAPVTRPPRWPAIEMPGTVKVKTRLRMMTGSTAEALSRSRRSATKSTAKSPKIAPDAPAVSAPGWKRYEATSPPSPQTR